MVESNNKLYSIIAGEILLVLEGKYLEIIAGIIAAQPKKVNTLHRLLSGNGQLEKNTMLEVRDAVIDLKTT